MAGNRPSCVLASCALLLVACQSPARSLDERSLPELLAAQRGRVVLLHFWGVFCKPCVNELPVYARLADRYGPRGVSLQLVSFDPDAQRQRIQDVVSRLQPAQRSHHVREDAQHRVINLVDPGWSITGGVPATFIYDRTGKKRFARLGILAERELVAQLTPLL